MDESDGNNIIENYYSYMEFKDFYTNFTCFYNNFINNFNIGNQGLQPYKVFVKNFNNDFNNVQNKGFINGFINGFIYGFNNNLINEFVDEQYHDNYEESVCENQKIRIFYCILCNKCFKGRQKFQNHLETRKHFNNITKLEELKKIYESHYAKLNEEFSSEQKKFLEKM